MTDERCDDDAEAPVEETESGVAGSHQSGDHETGGEHKAEDESDTPRDPGRARRPGRRRRRARLLLAVTITIGVLVAPTCWMFVWPQTDPPGQVDAVLVLAGGGGERETTAARLVQQGVAPVIVFSDGGDPESASARQCQQRIPGTRVVCLHAEADSTRGEARAFSELAAQEGWRSVAVVTSSYHVRRASLLVDRCFDGTVHPVAAGLGPNGMRIALSVLREVGAFLIANTAERGC